MRRLIFTALMAASLLPTAAMAQSQNDIRHDERRIQDDRRDVRDARRDLRDDVQDRNRQWARDDWRRWRDNNRGLYARGGWRAPFRYTAFRVGARIAPAYYAPSFFVVDPWRYHLPPARPGTRWVRHYDDVVLVDVRRGIVLDVIRGFYF